MGWVDRRIGKEQICGSLARVNRELGWLARDKTTMEDERMRVATDQSRRQQMMTREG